DRGLRGTKLRTRPKVRLGRVLSLSQKGLVEYIIRSLIRERPRLLPWTFENLSVIEVARYLLRYKSKSLQGFYTICDTVYRYTQWLGYSPDQIIADIKDSEGVPLQPR